MNKKITSVATPTADAVSILHFLGSEYLSKYSCNTKNVEYAKQQHCSMKRCFVIAKKRIAPLVCVRNK